MHLCSKTSEVEPVLCLTAYFKTSFSTTINHLWMAVQKQRNPGTLASYSGTLSCSLHTNSSCHENTAIYLDLSGNKSVLSVHLVV